MARREGETIGQFKARMAREVREVPDPAEVIREANATARDAISGLGRPKRLRRMSKFPGDYEG